MGNRTPQPLTAQDIGREKGVGGTCESLRAAAPAARRALPPLPPARPLCVPVPAFPVPALAPGEYYTREIRVNVDYRRVTSEDWPCGNYAFTALVDLDLRTAESDEGNNTNATAYIGLGCWGVKAAAPELYRRMR